MIKSSIGRYIARAAKALVVSKPIVIFYAGHGKSSLVWLRAVSVTDIFAMEISRIL